MLMIENQFENQKSAKDYQQKSKINLKHA